MITFENEDLAIPKQLQAASSLSGGLSNVVRYARWVNGRIRNPVTPFRPDVGGRVVE
jgi:hypothetical protein